jgi:hypothetical protein
MGRTARAIFYQDGDEWDFSRNASFAKGLNNYFSNIKCK